MSTLTRKELEQFAAVAPRLKFGNLDGVLDYSRVVAYAKAADRALGEIELNAQHSIDSGYPCGNCIQNREEARAHRLGEE